MLDLTRPCDSCGRMIGGAFKICPKCKIYFCNLCAQRLMFTQNQYPAECPMCGEKLMFL